MNALVSIFRRSLILIALLGLTSTVGAQENPEEALLNQEALLGGDGLEVRKPIEKPVLDDPDPALLKTLDQATQALETYMNALPEKVDGYAKLDKRLQKLTAKMLKLSDAYVENANTQLEAYRAAVKDGDKKVEAKLAKTITKARGKQLKALKKLKKKMKKLAKDTDKAIAKDAKIDK